MSDCVLSDHAVPLHGEQKISDFNKCRDNDNFERLTVATQLKYNIENNSFLYFGHRIFEESTEAKTLTAVKRFRCFVSVSFQFYFSCISTVRADAIRRKKEEKFICHKQ